MNGTLPEAAYTMYNSAWNGNFLVVLYVVIGSALLIKTKSPELVFLMGLTLFILFYSYFNTLGFTVMLISLVFLLVGILWKIFWKN